MQGVKDAAANIAASAVSGMEKTKATVQEKMENMTTHDPEQREMARERKQERITQAEIDKQEAKQYREASSKYGASATGGQGYYSSEATGGCLTSGHDTYTHSAAEDTGYPMGAHQTSAMRGHGTGQHYGGQEEGMVSTYPGGLPGDSTTRRNTRAGGTAFRTGTDGTGHSYGTDGTGYTTGTDGTGYGTGQQYGGQEEGVMSTYPDGLPGDSIADHNTRAGGNAFRSGTDGTGYGTRQPYGRQMEEGVEIIYPDGLPGDSTTYHNTRAGGNAFRTGTDGTGYTTGTDGTGYGTRQPYGRQVEGGVENIYPDGLPGDSTPDHNTRAGRNAFRTGTDDTEYTTEYTTGTDGTGYTTGTGTGSNAADWRP